MSRFIVQLLINGNDRLDALSKIQLEGGHRLYVLDVRPLADEAAVDLLAGAFEQLYRQTLGAPAAAPTRFVRTDVDTAEMRRPPVPNAADTIQMPRVTAPGGP